MNGRSTAEVRGISALFASGAPFHVFAPATGEELAALPTSTDADVDAAFAMARSAQRRWAHWSISARAAVFLRFHDLLLRHRHEVLDVVQAETGKARKDANEEVLDVCLVARHYARDAHRLLRPRRYLGAFPLIVGTEVVRHPKGVVGVISPWNYPLTLAISDAIPALLAGNAVVIKPDQQTTLSALWVADLLSQAGLPEDLFVFVTGDGATVGPTVVDRADFIMFTGSTRVGREVAARCGERLIDFSMELGGKNAMIIRADADPEKAAATAVRACFSNAGQLCMSVERIYVVQPLFDQFLAAFVRRTQALRLSADIGWAGDVGSLISAAHLQRVSDHVAEAVANGAHVAVGGQTRPDVGPYFYEPTVLTHVDESMLLCRQETFGPVVAVYPVATEAEAIAKANDSEYGLNASVLSADVGAAQAMARQLRAGMVNINEGYAPGWASKRAPMGGVGASGMGRRHGDDGMLKYTDAQTITTQRVLSMGAPPGWTEERWGNVLATSLGVMKRMGFK